MEVALSRPSTENHRGKRGKLPAKSSTLPKKQRRRSSRLSLAFVTHSPQVNSSSRPKEGNDHSGWPLTSSLKGKNSAASRPRLPPPPPPSPRLFHDPTFGLPHTQASPTSPLRACARSSTVSAPPPVSSTLCPPPPLSSTLCPPPPLSSTLCPPPPLSSTLCPPPPLTVLLPSENQGGGSTRSEEGAMLSPPSSTCPPRRLRIEKHVKEKTMENLPLSTSSLPSDGLLLSGAIKSLSFKKKCKTFSGSKRTNAAAVLSNETVLPISTLSSIVTSSSHPPEDPLISKKKSSRRKRSPPSPQGGPLSISTGSTHISAIKSEILLEGVPSTPLPPPLCVSLIPEDFPTPHSPSATPSQLFSTPSPPHPWGGLTPSSGEISSSRVSTSPGDSPPAVNLSHPLFGNPTFSTVSKALPSLSKSRSSRRFEGRIAPPRGRPRGLGRVYVRRCPPPSPKNLPFSLAWTQGSRLRSILRLSMGEDPSPCSTSSPPSSLSARFLRRYRGIPNMSLFRSTPPLSEGAVSPSISTCMPPPRVALPVEATLKVGRVSSPYQEEAISPIVPSVHTAAASPITSETHVKKENFTQGGPPSKSRSKKKVKEVPFDNGFSSGMVDLIEGVKHAEERGEKSLVKSSLSVQETEIGKMEGGRLLPGLSTDGYSSPLPYTASVTTEAYLQKFQHSQRELDEKLRTFSLLDERCRHFRIPNGKRRKRLTNDELATLEALEMNKMELIALSVVHDQLGHIIVALIDETVEELEEDIVNCEFLSEKAASVQSLKETTRVEGSHIHGRSPLFLPSMFSVYERICFCNQFPFGSIIVCENTECCFGNRFHMACVGLSQLPTKEWWCPGCLHSDEFFPVWNHFLKKKFRRKKNQRVEEAARRDAPFFQDSLESSFPLSLSKQFGGNNPPNCSFPKEEAERVNTEAASKEEIKAYSMGVSTSIAIVKEEKDEKTSTFCEERKPLVFSLSEEMVAETNGSIQTSGAPPLSEFPFVSKFPHFPSASTALSFLPFLPSPYSLPSSPVIVSLTQSPMDASNGDLKRNFDISLKGEQRGAPLFPSSQSTSLAEATMNLASTQASFPLLEGPAHPTSSSQNLAFSFTPQDITDCREVANTAETASTGTLPSLRPSNASETTSLHSLMGLTPYEGNALDASSVKQSATISSFSYSRASHLPSSIGFKDTRSSPVASLSVEGGAPPFMPHSFRGLPRLSQRTTEYGRKDGEDYYPPLFSNPLQSCPALPVASRTHPSAAACAAPLSVFTDASRNTQGAAMQNPSVPVAGWHPYMHSFEAISTPEMALPAYTHPSISLHRPPLPTRPSMAMQPKGLEVASSMYSPKQSFTFESSLQSLYSPRQPRICSPLLSFNHSWNLPPFNDSLEVHSYFGSTAALGGLSLTAALSSDCLDGGETALGEATPGLGRQKASQGLLSTASTACMLSVPFGSFQPAFSSATTTSERQRASVLPPLSTPCFHSHAAIESVALDSATVSHVDSTSTSWKSPPSFLGKGPSFCPPMHFHTLSSSERYPFSIPTFSSVSSPSFSVDMASLGTTYGVAAYETMNWREALPSSLIQEDSHSCGESVPVERATEEVSLHPASPDVHTPEVSRHRSPFPVSIREIDVRYAASTCDSHKSLPKEENSRVMFTSRSQESDDVSVDDDTIPLPFLSFSMEDVPSHATSCYDELLLDTFSALLEEASNRISKEKQERQYLASSNSFRSSPLLPLSAEALMIEDKGKSSVSPPFDNTWRQREAVLHSSGLLYPSTSSSHEMKEKLPSPCDSCASVSRMGATSVCTPVATKSSTLDSLIKYPFVWDTKHVDVTTSDSDIPCCPRPPKRKKATKRSTSRTAAVQNKTGISHPGISWDKTNQAWRVFVPVCKITGKRRFKYFKASKFVTQNEAMEAAIAFQKATQQEEATKNKCHMSDPNVDEAMSTSRQGMQKN
ncbi:hypothetical protein IE077_003962 [Cardiosporidium cionae]|uniref:Zinc finger PHD-type domain-containing protein n=1 Tax=Cardiosporidium cionae TaxID=476202 RepID=A0ABQ7J739_9APIC|nr:hypothetical protein IE077_003962 [Cardiosporidium cionae]|eukprot:KAF8819810.1 hypothetical protein IE077_003962 [Cardiosporidium cionae]